MSYKKILIFGGTTEGRELADELTKRGIPHTVSVATDYGEEILREKGESDLLVGRKSADDIEKLISSDGYEVVVDATHPFATAASCEIKKACGDMGVSYLRLSRNTENDLQSDSRIICSDTLEYALNVLKKEEGTILLLTGSKDLKKITDELSDTKRLYARVLPNEESIRKCSEAGLSGRQIIAMQGPFSKRMNMALIEETGADVILTKESGKTGGLDEKLAAAADCGIKAVVIRNPESLDDRSKGESFEEVLRKLEKLAGSESEISEQDIALEREKKTKAKKIALAGIGPGKDSYFTKELMDALKKADVIFGAASVVSRLGEVTKRNTSASGNTSATHEVNIYGRCIPVSVHYMATDILNALEERDEFVSPLAVFSGDISLCSGAKAAAKLFSENGYEVERIAGISSVALFAGLLGIGLEDVRIVSAHGRQCNVIGHVRRNEQTIILPSDKEHAAEICRGIIKAFSGCDEAGNFLQIIIGFELGTDEEKFFDITSEKDMDEYLNSPSGKSIIYVRNDFAKTFPVNRGLLDDEIIRGKVPMTKEEIRALSMRKLALTNDSVLFDIGAGTGSISLEAAMTAPDIKVFAIEKNPDALLLINMNRERLSLSNIEVVQGEAPDALNLLPTPSHVFIGGSSGKMRRILKAVFDKNEYAKVVINCVTIETISELSTILDELCQKDTALKTDIIQVGVTRFKKAGKHHLSDALNPVYIITLQKERG